MTPKYYYIRYTEYDMNHEGMIFRKYSDAFKFGKKQFEDSTDGESWDDYVNAGFFEVDEATIYGE